MAHWPMLFHVETILTESLIGFSILKGHLFAIKLISLNGQWSFEHCGNAQILHNIERHRQFYAFIGFCGIKISVWISLLNYNRRMALAYISHHSTNRSKTSQLQI